MSPISSIDFVAIRHPAQVRLRRPRAGSQKTFDYIDLLLDSGSRPAKRRSSGMTGSAKRAQYLKGISNIQQSAS
jgi:hypothetical protein